MLNAEKYKDRILEVASNHKVFGIDTKNNKIDNCSSMKCRDCLFYTFGTISEHDVNRIKWLLSEYKEPLKVSKLEYDIMLYLYRNTKFRYIARDEGGYLYAYYEPVDKGAENWIGGEYYETLDIFDTLFKFVKWEDEKPTSIEEILKKCVVENIKEEQ